MSTPCVLTFEFTAVDPSAMLYSSPSQLTLDKLLQWFSIVPVHTSQRIFNGSHNHKQINSDSTHSGNINFYFNIFKLTSLYWQTISYQKICRSLKFSLLSLLMSIANWLGNQQLAMLTRLMHLHFQYCFWVQFQESYTTSTLRQLYMCQIIS